MMWRRSLSRPGAGGLPTASHSSRDCPPFQAFVVKPRISTLTPQRSSVRAKNIGAAGRNHDRPAAHRARIVEQQRHDGVAEVHVALAFERQRAHRIGDDAGEARRIEHAFFKIEIPAAVLLRKQPALQLVGELRDGG